MGTTARRIGYAVAGLGIATLAAFAASTPAYADNGPHVSRSGSAVIGSGPDGCAGCHRIHSAKAEDFLFKSGVDQEAFCESCHDGTGATTDVADGVSTMGTSLSNTALRAGGFETTRMGTGAAIQGSFYERAPGAISVNRTGNPATPDASGVARASSIPVVATGAHTTSTHQLGEVTMWGSGLSGVGAKVEMECTSCHDPHGNGNYRILRPNGSVTDAAGTAVAITDIAKEYAAVTAALVEADSKVPSTKFQVTFTVAKNVFVPGQAVTVRAAGATGAVYAAGTVMAITNTSFTIKNLAKPTTFTFTVGTAAPLAGYAMVNYTSTVLNAKAVGTAYTYTTAANHGMYKGQVVTIGVASGTASDYAVSKGIVTATPSLTTFTVTGVKADPAAVGLEAGLYIVGIPDAIATSDKTGPGIPVGVAGYEKVYTTDDYMWVDDHYYSGTYKANALWTDAAGGTNKYVGQKSGYIMNVSQWCATCHTRYLASSGSRSYASTINGVVDPIFTFRHSSASAGEGSANCIQCHVAHGSSAQMTGAFSSTITVPGTTTASNSSRLLRADNRGMCILCHAV